ncbi:MAG: ABC transporter permease [Bacteroidales bacterium]|jgi:putative ABC transport system permease protein|nr:ABC transporter permease [Bacteroidales bacterium]
MLKNYFKIAIRNLISQKFFSIINILGLATGIAATILLLLFVQHELSYDKFHKNYDNTYRVISSIKQGDAEPMVVPVALANAAEVIATEVPEVVSACKLDKRGANVTVNNKVFTSQQFFYVDSTFFSIFSFPVISGDPKEALYNPKNIVITRSAAKRYFGDQNPINQQMKLNGTDFTVKCLIENIPANSHFSFDFITSFTSIGQLDRYYGSRGFGFFTYFVVDEKAKTGNWKSKVIDVSNKNINQRFKDEGMDHAFTINTAIQKMVDIHLYSDYNWEIAPQGNIRNIYIYSFLAFFIIIIAIINFVNLVTARSETRSNEIGLRKVVGAQRSHIIKQFLGEAVIVSFISLVVALLIVELFINSFSSLVNRELVMNYSYVSLILFFIVLAFFIGLVAGAYPAVYLSKFNPVRILKGITKKGRSNEFLKKGLVIFQFSIAVFLIIALLVMNLQIKFVKSKDLGFDKEHVMVIENLKPGIYRDLNVIKSALQDVPQVVSVSGSENIPTYHMVQNAYKKGDSPDNSIVINEMAVQDDFVETYGLEIAEGRNFDSKFRTDTFSFIINETAARKMGLQHPVGEKIYVWKAEGEIVGVIKDFHFNSFHQEIEPLVLTKHREYISYLSVKVTGERLSQTIASIEKIINKYNNGYEFRYYFMDDRFDNLYQEEERSNKLILFGSVLAIIIAMLGVFALTSFTVIKRTKEIGIRKVVGMPVRRIVWMLLADISKWVLVANLVAWPLAYYFMNSWLNHFAYKIELKIWMFIAGAFIAFLIAMITVIVLAYRAALANPANALRHE